MHVWIYFISKYLWHDLKENKNKKSKQKIHQEARTFYKHITVNFIFLVPPSCSYLMVKLYQLPTGLIEASNFSSNKLDT